MAVKAEIILAALCREEGLPSPQFEFRFHDERKWRFDLAWPRERVAVEIEGGAFSRGRHTRGAGFVADLEKYNTAVLLGWRVLRFTPSQARTNAVETIKELWKKPEPYEPENE